MECGFTSLWKKIHLPTWLLFGIAAICDFIGKLIGKTFKLSYFNVLVLTMHRWFDISAAEKDLDFKPIIGFREGWDETKAWFKANWLPTFRKDMSLLGISDTTQEKIDIQDGKKTTMNSSKPKEE